MKETVYTLALSETWPKHSGRTSLKQWPTAPQEAANAIPCQECGGELRPAPDAYVEGVRVCVDCGATWGIEISPRRQEGENYIVTIHLLRLGERVKKPAAEYEVGDEG